MDMCIEFDYQSLFLPIDLIETLTTQQRQPTIREGVTTNCSKKNTSDIEEVQKPSSIM